MRGSNSSRAASRAASLKQSTRRPSAASTRRARRRWQIRLAADRLEHLLSFQPSRSRPEAVAKPGANHARPRCHGARPRSQPDRAVRQVDPGRTPRDRAAAAPTHRPAGTSGRPVRPLLPRPDVQPERRFKAHQADAATHSRARGWSRRPRRVRSGRAAIGPSPGPLSRRGRRPPRSSGGRRPGVAAVRSCRVASLAASLHTLTRLRAGSFAARVKWRIVEGPRPPIGGVAAPGERESIRCRHPTMSIGAQDMIDGSTRLGHAFWRGCARTELSG